MREKTALVLIIIVTIIIGVYVEKNAKKEQEKFMQDCLKYKNKHECEYMRHQRFNHGDGSSDLFLFMLLK